MWNPESTGMESGIHSVETGIQDSLGLPYMGRTIVFVRHFKNEIPLTIDHGREMSTISGNVYVRLKEFAYALKIRDLTLRTTLIGNHEKVNSL